MPLSVLSFQAGLWEDRPVLFHGVEGEGGFDQGEGGDGGHGDVLGGKGGVEGGEADLVGIVRLLDVLDGRVGVPIRDEGKQINLSPEDAVE